MDGRRESPELRDVARSFVDEDLDREVKRGYLAWFDGATRVIDVGCGEGAFLDLLRDAGVGAVGVEASSAAASACRSRGHEVCAGDAVDVLRQMAERGEAFDGVLVAHLIEHLAPPRAAELLSAIIGVLNPGGRTVIVTPNVRNAIVLEETFWLDPTHVRPYPRALIERLCVAVGLRVVRSFGDPATRPRRPAWKRWLAAARSALTGVDRSGPMDAVVVAERP